MISREKKSWFAPIFIITVLTTVFTLLYVSNNLLQKGVSPERKEFDYGGRPVQPMVNSNQVVLTLNKRFDVGKNSLVFKGIEKKKIVVDLYLLEMDPKQPYRKRFSKKEAKNEVILGATRYQLVSVSKNNLVLKKAQ